MQMLLAFLLCAIAYAENYKINRNDGLKASDWLLPVFIGVAVGLAIIMFGFLVWTKVEGFAVCAHSRAEAERKKIQGDNAAREELNQRVMEKQEEQTAV